jgi:hypothetical protein
MTGPFNQDFYPALYPFRRALIRFTEAARQEVLFQESGIYQAVGIEDRTKAKRDGKLAEIKVHIQELLKHIDRMLPA